MSILKVNPGFFTGDSLNIPNISSTGVGASGAISLANADKLQKLIDEKEPKFLKQVLGKDLYFKFKDGMGAITPENKWMELSKLLVNTESKTSPFANYVWWHWSRNKVSSATGTGESVDDKENARSVSPIGHQVRVWNDMVDMLSELRDYMESNSFIYDDLFLPDEDVYSTQNAFNF